MGFGGVAQDIFRVLDRHGHGTFNYRNQQQLTELTHFRRVLATASSVLDNENVKRLLTSMVWLGGEERLEAKKNSIDTSSWKLKGTDPEAVRRDLHGLLARSGAAVVELIKLFDDDAGPSAPPPSTVTQLSMRTLCGHIPGDVRHTRAHPHIHHACEIVIRAPTLTSSPRTGADTELLIDDMEFYKAMRTKFGYQGPKEVIDKVFVSLDTDGDGHIGFDELFEFIRGW